MSGSTTLIASSRISERRVAAGLTQEQLSSRIAMSRAALSHLEAGINVAGERSVCLLAGAFDVEPHELVAGTDFPIAKAERLPLAVPRHTQVDLVLAIVDNDLAWCARLEDRILTARVVNDWLTRLAEHTEGVDDPDERARLRDARRRLLARVPRCGGGGARLPSARLLDIPTDQLGSRLGDREER